MSDKTVYNNSDYIKSVGQLSFWTKAFAFLSAFGGIFYGIYAVMGSIYIITIPLTAIIFVVAFAFLKISSSLFRTAFFAKRSLDAESKEEYIKDITGVINSSGSYFMISGIITIAMYVLLALAILLFLLFAFIGALV
jgi:hypothetical protein